MRQALKLLAPFGALVERRLSGGGHINHQCNPSKFLGEQGSLKRTGQAVLSGFWGAVIRIWTTYPVGVKGRACVMLGEAGVRKRHHTWSESQESEKNAHQQAPSRRAKSITGQCHHNPCLGS